MLCSDCIVENSILLDKYRFGVSCTNKTYYDFLWHTQCACRKYLSIETSKKKSRNESDAQQFHIKRKL